MTYYAKANTEKENSFASDVYFLEVRPFREDILKMPGGESGEAYQCLSELSALISRQQHVIRQTHQHLQNPPDAGEPAGAGPEEAVGGRSGPGRFGAASLRQDGGPDGEQADRRGAG